MLFNSIEFIIFISIFFLFYWNVFNRNLKLQNFFVLVSSYVFYGWWDWRFLILIFLSTAVDFIVGLKIQSSKNPIKKKVLLCVSVLFNLGILGFFKYFNFFIESWIDLFLTFGYEIKSTWTLNIILPVGISFYTFQTMSYSIDVYRKKLSPTSDFISFASFVSFFPQLVAGPIERATNLLPQLLKKRAFTYEQGNQGLRLIIWGLFKKVVIADSLAPTVDYIFSNYSSLDGGILWLGVIYFSFQIYCDFSGYSDIAIGTSKLLGIELKSNFRFPYFSRNIGEFWRRWHISLSTWFRDYLYIPLGGSKKGTWNSIRNILIIFIVSGIWHGANWTFIAWGLLHALYFIPLFLLHANRKYTQKVIAEESKIPNLKECSQVALTFILVTIAWVFFRSDSLFDSFNYLKLMFTDWGLPQHSRMAILYIIPFIVIEFTLRKNERLNGKMNVVWENLLMLITVAIIIYHFDRPSSFIYFQF